MPCRRAVLRISNSSMHLKMRNEVPCEFCLGCIFGKASVIHTSQLPRHNNTIRHSVRQSMTKLDFGIGVKNVVVASSSRINIITCLPQRCPKFYRPEVALRPYQWPTRRISPTRECVPYSRAQPPDDL
eukprot:scaffold1321_cov38-Prasinocladus_malaysianus.AAC.1